MKTIVLLTLLAASFTEQNLPNLLVGDVNPLTGKPRLYYRHADLDENGELDLILSQSVYFQHDGTFDITAPLSIPGHEKRPLCDTFGGDIYLLFPKRIHILRLEDKQWVTLLDHEVAWPDGVVPPPKSQTDLLTNPGVVFSRFLHDIDGDAVPEIVIPDELGVHIYRQSGAVLFKANTLILYPEPLPAVPASVSLWPPNERRLRFPPRSMACTLYLDHNHIVVTTRHNSGIGQVIFRTARYTLQVEEAFGIDPQMTKVTTSAPLPDYMEPCRLNDDAIPDYAGGAWSPSTTSPLPIPIYETSATTDLGQTLTRRRTRSYRPANSFLDFDSDGDLDMVTHRIDLFDGGLREALNRLFTSRSVVDEVAVYLQRDGAFDPHPILTRRFTILLDKPPARNTRRFQRFQAGELVDLTGDFNGDGLKDALVQAEEGQIHLFFNTGSAFPKKPDVYLPNPESLLVRVADLNGDDYTDVLLMSAHGSTIGAHPQTTVYFLNGRDSP